MKPMKYAIEFRDTNVQAIAEALFPAEDLRFLMVSKILPVVPTTPENVLAFREIVKDAEADLARAKQLLAIVDMAAALAGGEYGSILRYSDSAEETGGDK